MTTRSRSAETGAFLDPAAPTLATLLEALAADTGATPKTRAEMPSAVRTLCRALGQAPEEVPADPALLNRAIQRVLPAAAGLSPGRWSNVKSLVLQALLKTGCRVLPGRALHPLTPAWAALDARLPSRYFRAALSRLMHYCARHGIAPDAVDQAVLDRFGAALLSDSFIRNQRAAHQTACRMWNRAVASVPGWPQVEVEVPRYRAPYVLPAAAFPLPFQDDVRRWLDRLAGKDLLDDGPLRPLRPRSLEQRAFYLRQAASILVHAGRDIATLTRLADLVEVEALRTILGFFLERAGGKPTSQTHGLATHLKAVARHHVGVDTIHLDRLGRMVARVAPKQQGLTPKNRRALRQFEDPALLHRLVRLAERVYAGLPRAGTLTPRQALRFQWALAVELLLVAPIRLANLTGLTFDHHLVRVGHGPRRRYHLVVDGSEVKNGQPIEIPLPVRVSERLERYRRIVHPALAGAQLGTAWVFPGASGAKSGVTLAGQIKRFLERELGCTLTPHQFRHLGAFIYLQQHPHGHEVVRALLGHRSIATTLGRYAGFEGAAAARLYDQVLGSMAEEQAMVTLPVRRKPRP